MHAKICMYVCMHASCKACITISYRVRVLSGRQTCRGVDLQVYAPSDRGPAMSRLRPSLASRWGCGSRLRRIWITLASAIVLLQVVLFRCRHVCACVCMYVYMWRPCSDWSLSSPAFPACRRPLMPDPPRAGALVCRWLWRGPTPAELLRKKVVLFPAAMWPAIHIIIYIRFEL
jgi:hypothetical protein